MNESIDKKSRSRSGLDNTTVDTEHRIPGGLVGGLFSRVQRKILEPVERQLAELNSRLGAAHSSHLQDLEEVKALAIDGIGSLRGDSGRVQSHLASLQKDHSDVREKVASLTGEYGKQQEALQRFEQIWADLHRDVTELADALQQLIVGPPED